jgi:hypothetical protein
MTYRLFWNKLTTSNADQWCIDKGDPTTLIYVSQFQVTIPCHGGKRESALPQYVGDPDAWVEIEGELQILTSETHQAVAVFSAEAPPTSS